jgi:CBS domain-containing protein
MGPEQEKQTALAFIEADASALTAVFRMRDANVDRLTVCENGRILGMVTERDVVVRCVSARRLPSQTRVRSILSCACTA